MDRPAAGRVAVVTGASRGIGRAIAEGLGRAGAEVVVVARDGDAVEAVADAIRRSGGAAFGVAADVSDPASVDALVASLGGRVPQILVNAAGVFGPMSLIPETSPEAWWHTLAVNAYGPYLTARRFAPGMIASGWGRILTVTSAASLHVPGALNSAYGTSKAAVNQLTRHLAAELAGTGVTANVFHPGDVRTEMFEDIRAQVEIAGRAADGNYGPWVQWVEETGGDDPSKAVDLVLRVVTGQNAVNGAFLWIDDPLQSPLPSWEPIAPEPTGA